MGIHYQPLQSSLILKPICNLRVPRNTEGSFTELTLPVTPTHHAQRIWLGARQRVTSSSRRPANWPLTCEYVIRGSVVEVVNSWQVGKRRMWCRTEAVGKLSAADCCAHIKQSCHVIGATLDVYRNCHQTATRKATLTLHGLKSCSMANDKKCSWLLLSV